jgi:hypothetical protein
LAISLGSHQHASDRAYKRLIWQATPKGIRGKPRSPRWTRDPAELSGRGSAWGRASQQAGRLFNAGHDKRAGRPFHCEGRQVSAAHREVRPANAVRRREVYEQETFGRNMCAVRRPSHNKANGPDNNRRDACSTGGRGKRAGCPFHYGLRQGTRQDDDRGRRRRTANGRDARSTIKGGKQGMPYVARQTGGTPAPLTIEGHQFTA